MPADRTALESSWLALTRKVLPALAAGRGWPVSADHCFQRILLDAACGGVWYDHIFARPAYAHASDTVLAEAVRLAEAVAAGEADLPALNRRSLAWRRGRSAGSGNRGAASGSSPPPPPPRARR